MFFPDLFVTVVGEIGQRARNATNAVVAASGQTPAFHLGHQHVGCGLRECCVGVEVGSV